MTREKLQMGGICLQIGVAEFDEPEAQREMRKKVRR